jgi:hypothetical protein
MFLILNTLDSNIQWGFDARVEHAGLVLEDGLPTPPHNDDVAPLVAGLNGAHDQVNGLVLV